MKILHQMFVCFLSSTIELQYSILEWIATLFYQLIANIRIKRLSHRKWDFK